MKHSNLICAFTLFFTFSLPAGLRAEEALPVQFAKWTAAGVSTRNGAVAIEEFSGKSAPVLRESGVVWAERRTYNSNGRSLIATLYKLQDTSGAYAAFTALRTPGMAATGLARFSAADGQRALIVLGQQVLYVSGLEGASLADVRDLVAMIGLRADRAAYPTIEEHLPDRGKVPASEKYLLGPVALQLALPENLRQMLPTADWVGFGGGAEAALARYRSGRDEAVLLLIAYPTPQVAAAKLKQIERQFPKTAHAGSTGSPSQGEEQPPLVIGRRTGSLLSLAIAAKTTQAADTLLNGVRYQPQVTWSEPTYQFKEPSINVMIAEAFIGTGIILVFALIAGVGFGGVRLLTKYFLPGKIFDRREHVEILQLGISSKPIEARDFY